MVRWLLGTISAVGRSDLYLAYQRRSACSQTHGLMLEICGTIDAMPGTLATDDQWNEWQWHLSKYTTHISPPHLQKPYSPRQETPQHVPLESPTPSCTPPESPPSKTARIHSHPDHRGFSSWDPGPHQHRSWGWNIDKIQESWDGVREALVLIGVGHFYRTMTDILVVRTGRQSFTALPTW